MKKKKSEQKQKKELIIGLIIIGIIAAFLNFNSEPLDITQLQNNLNNNLAQNLQNIQKKLSIANASITVKAADQSVKVTINTQNRSDSSIESTPKIQSSFNIKGTFENDFTNGSIKALLISRIIGKKNYLAIQNFELNTGEEFVEGIIKSVIEPYINKWIEIPGSTRINSKYNGIAELGTGASTGYAKYPFLVLSPTKQNRTFNTTINKQLLNKFAEDVRGYPLSKEETKLSEKISNWNVQAKYDRQGNMASIAGTTAIINNSQTADLSFKVSVRDNRSNGNVSFKTADAGTNPISGSIRFNTATTELKRIIIGEPRNATPISEILEGLPI